MSYNTAIAHVIIQLIWKLMFTKILHANFYSSYHQKLEAAKSRCLSKDECVKNPVIPLYNETQFGDEEEWIYTIIESLCCTPDNNIMSYVNYISIKKRNEYNMNES